MRCLVVLALMLSACGSAPDPAKPVADGAIVRVALPDEPVAPWTGPGGALIERNCAACHSSEMIANQPPLSAEKWQATIDKMRTVYAAKVDTADDAALVRALQDAQTR